MANIKTGRELKLALAEGLRYSGRNPDITRYKPHEKQLQFHSSEAPGRQLIGGNRSGKTVGGGAETVMYARGIHPYKRLKWQPPLRLRVVTVDIIEGLEKIVLPEIAKWMPPSSLINGNWEDSYRAPKRTLYLNNGSFIEFLTHEQKLASFAGTSRHGIWFDEEPPKAIFTECKLRLLDTEGDWWMTMTPVEGMTWTYEDIYMAAENDPLIDIIEVDMDDNPHLSDVGKQIALSGLSKEDIEARKHGQYVSIGGLIYPEFTQRIDEILIDPYPFPLSNEIKSHLHFNAMDAGYTNATCWLWAFVTKDGTIVIYDEYYVTKEIIETHAINVKMKNIQHGLIPSYSVGDPAIRQTMPNTGVSIQVEYMENGLPIAIGNNDVRAGIDRVKKMFNLNKLKITRNCTNLIWELKRYRWATWKHTKDQFEKNKKEEPQKKDDHACDTLRYLVASRPEIDDGTAVVSVGNFIGAVESIDPDKPFYDPEFKKSSLNTSRHIDLHLGEEF